MLVCQRGSRGCWKGPPCCHSPAAVATAVASLRHCTSSGGKQQVAQWRVWSAATWTEKPPPATRSAKHPSVPGGRAAAMVEWVRARQWDTICKYNPLFRR